MRRLLLTVVIGLWPMLATADDSIAGQWQADLGQKVIIAMDVLADGHWSSQTVQDNIVVAEMAGTYIQKKKDATSGTLIFNPLSSKTSAGHGKAQVETDQYSLQKNGTVLRLVVGKDVMMFNKQPYAE